jgi:hypothetical protein
MPLLSMLRRRHGFPVLRPPTGRRSAWSTGVWASSLWVSTIALVAVVATWDPPGDRSVGRPIAEVTAAGKVFAAGPIVRYADVGTVGTYPARADGLAPAAAVPPVSVKIEALGVDAPIVPVGVESDTGAMSVPPDGGVIGWYEFGPAPGLAGSAVLAGHVDYGGRPGAFFDLRRLEPGAEILVSSADGTARRFVVQGRQEFAKPDLPVAELFSRTGPAALMLVTCGGSYDRAARSYSDNVIVYAVPA